MTSVSLDLSPDPSVAVGEVHIPDGHPHPSLVGKLLIVNAGDDRAYLVAKKKPIGRGPLAHVNADSLPIAEITRGTAVVSRKWRWRFLKLWSTGNGKAAVVSFVVALTAGVTQLAFSVPDNMTVVTVDEGLHDSVSWLTKAVAPIGTIVTFVTGTLNR